MAYFVGKITIKTWKIDIFSYAGKKTGNVDFYKQLMIIAGKQAEWRLVTRGITAGGLVRVSTDDLATL